MTAASMYQLKHVVSSLTSYHELRLSLGMTRFSRISNSLMARVAAAAVFVLVAFMPLSAQNFPSRSSIPNPFPKVPEGHGARFELRDERALSMLQYMNCMNNTVTSAQRGMLGIIPENAVLACVREKDGWRGVFGVANRVGDGINFRIIAQVSMQGTNAVRTNAPVDTVRVVSAIMASARGQEAMSGRNKGKYETTAVPLQFESFMELWFMPVQNNASKLFVGGDSLIQMTVDGRREQGHFQKSPPVRELPMPSGRVFEIASTEDELPLVSELMAARLSLLRVPEVRIVTRKYTSVISNTTRKWVHTERRN